MTLIAAHDIGIQLGEREILRNVSLSVDRGEVHALLGPNGVGKSTLLSVLAHDRAPDAGYVELLGKPLPDWSLREQARVRAVLTQDHQVSFPFTAREVVMLGRQPWAKTAQADEDERVVDLALAQVEMAEHADQPVTTLSGGERARVALARILAQDAELIMLDEPTAALDLRHQELALQTVRSLSRDTDRPRGVFLVIHDLNLAAAYADTVTLLSDGGVAAQGSPHEVLTAKLVSEVYQQPVEVVKHPVTGSPVIVPLRTIA